MAEQKDYDFSCWVIKYDHSNHNGRTYKKDCLKNNDGIVVTLLWIHDHSYNTNHMLGHALLEHRDGDGVYAYGTLTSNPNINIVKDMLKDYGRLSLSPYINKLKIYDNIITEGSIREVSLVPERVDQDEIYYPVWKGVK